MIDYRPPFIRPPSFVPDAHIECLDQAFGANDLITPKSNLPFAPQPLLPEGIFGRNFSYSEYAIWARSSDSEVPAVYGGYSGLLPARGRQTSALEFRVHLAEMMLRVPEHIDGALQKCISCVAVGTLGRQ